MSRPEHRFLCPHCRQKLACEDGYAGWQIQCPACNGSVIVPLNLAAPSMGAPASRTGHLASTAPSPRVEAMRVVVKWCRNLGIAMVVLLAVVGILNGALYGRTTVFDRAFMLGFRCCLWAAPILLFVSGTAGLIGRIPAGRSVARHLAALAVGMVMFSFIARLAVEGLPRPAELSEQAFWLKQLGYGLAFFGCALLVAHQYTPSLLGQIAGGLLGPIFAAGLGWSLGVGLEAGCGMACGGGLGPPSRIPREVHLQRFGMAFVGLLGSSFLLLFLIAWLKSIRPAK